ncbi:hypothetical protein FNV43_RR12907 [Rhamnella rubrinervis]|uniref:non-specific serine/threonine protein kinase n=1 Tax=Rhamnella rubrinervis TaxID=2594499 RepID=A0A8K0MEB4_9ROSA|nr:hypothetical protein FNV43_RR12907 [Rhamnella rubrinervis]
MGRVLDTTNIEISSACFCGAFGSYNEKSMPYCNCLKRFVPKLESNWNLEDYSGECQMKTKLMCGNNISTNGLLVLKQTTEDKSTGKNLYVRLAASELRSSKENNMIGIGVVVGGVAGFAVLIGLIVLIVTFFTKELEFLKWETRYQIALGTTRGLLYLHEKCRDCIVHYDIKPDNILLDAEFCPKVADFGMAKLVGRDFSWVLTTMRGTRGYLAPEWI